MQVVSLLCSGHTTSEGGAKSTGFCILPVVFGSISDSYVLAITGAEMLEVGRSISKAGFVVVEVPGLEVGGRTVLL